MKRSDDKFVILLFVLIFFNFCMYGQTKFIEFGDEWRYYDEVEAPPKGWQNSHEITASWKVGASRLGYGKKHDIKTTVGFGGDPKNRVLATYFTKIFHIKDPFQYIMYQIKIQKDDGAVIYLNGKEIFRVDIPLGEVTHVTKASRAIFSSKEEKVLYPVLISPEDLKVGENFIGVSVHQYSETSWDLIFNLELTGHNDVEMLRVIEKERTLKNLYTDLKLKDLEHKQEIEKKSFEKKLIEQKSSSYKIYLIGLFIFILASFIVLFQIWITFTRRNKELIAANDVLVNQDQTKSSEMMNICLSSLNSKQLLKVVQKDLEESLNKSSTAAIKKEVHKVVKNINYNMDATEDWENLKKHFNVVHSGYVDTLSELHPILSDVELRHCIFIKLHMQTKEIADVLHIDPRSVQSSRYRIKKKMGLEENVSLKEYLLNLS